MEKLIPAGAMFATGAALGFLVSSAKPKIRSTEELRSELLKSSPPPPATPAEWDENRLETDVLYRGQYLADFINFGKEDVDAIHDVAAVLAPLVPTLTDAVYNHLFSYVTTKRHFVPRNEGFTGEVAKSIEELTLNHEQIKFRKMVLGRYLTRLVTDKYNGQIFSYLDWVGKMHTSHGGAHGHKLINVPLVQMNALMGWLADILILLIAAIGLPRDKEINTIRAFQKLLWIQNDLINRHYATGAPTSADSVLTAK